MSEQEEESMSLEAIEQALRKVEIKDRTYHFKTYKDCFVGSEAVNILVSTGVAQSREDAVLIGRHLANETGLFEHVTRDHEFSDDKLFYKFVDESERGSRGVKGGKTVGWADFLYPTSMDSDEKKGLKDRQPELPLPDLSLVDPKDFHVAKDMWPLDQYNASLLDKVHPAQWNDPAPHRSVKDGQGADYSYDLVVIGAGTGGLVSAAGSAGVGAKVALIEASLMGGDCLNVGCVPSKALIHSANLAHTLRGDTEHLAESGISIKGGADAVQIDFGKVMERLRRIRSEIAVNDSAERFTKKLGVELFFGKGTFTSDRTVTVNGRVLEFKRAVIATGGYPALIPMKGLKELYDKAGLAAKGELRPAVMTNETIFNLTTLPKRMAVIGSGVIGMELAQSMQRLGSSVTVFGRSGKVLPKEDQDLAELVKHQMERDGVTFRLSVAKYDSIELTGKDDNDLPELMMKFQEKKPDGTVVMSQLICDALLIATGRTPNVTGMDLEKANVKYDTKKGLVVNDKLQTTNPRIYGCGDCCSAFKFTHAADFTARAVIRNALFFGNAKMSDLLIPYATFTTPELASVGLYESDLKKRGIEFKVIEKNFDDNDRSICDSATTGLVRFRVDVKSGKILGASICGAGAGNMISEVTLAMQSDTRLGALASVIHPYPTTAESIRQSGDLYNKARLTPTVKSILRGVVKLNR